MMPSDRTDDAYREASAHAPGGTAVYVVDFEGSLKTGVVEFGVVCLEQGSMISTETGMCRPERTQDPRDVLLHGLRDEMLRKQPAFEAYREQFHDYRRRGVLAAHHAVVENGFLAKYWHTVPAGGADGHAYPSLGSWGPWIDSRLVCQRCYRGLPNYGLMSLIRQFSLQAPLDDLAATHCPPDRRKPHCALYDALASALLLLRVQQHAGLGLRDWVRLSQSGGEPDCAQQEWF